MPSQEALLLIGESQTLSFFNPLEGTSVVIQHTPILGDTVLPAGAWSRKMIFSYVSFEMCHPIQACNTCTCVCAFADSWMIIIGLVGEYFTGDVTPGPQATNSFSQPLCTACALWARRAR